MNTFNIRTEIHTNTIKFIRDKSIPTKDGLKVIVNELKAMGHALSPFSKGYPNTPPRLKEGQKPKTVVHVGFNANIEKDTKSLIDLIEQTVSTGAKTAVMTDIDPFMIGGVNVKTSNRPEAVLFRHTGFGAAQHRGFYREEFYDKNKNKRNRYKEWNKLVGRNMVTYVYNVPVLCRSELRITDSELPQTAANEGRLVKELYVDNPNTFNVIAFDMPRLNDNFRFNELSQSAKDTCKTTLYQKLYRAFEVANRNRIEVLIITDLGGSVKNGCSGLSNDLIEATIKQVMTEFKFFSNKQSLKKVVLNFK